MRRSGRPVRAVCLALSLALASCFASAAQARDAIRIGWLRGTNDITLGKARGTLEAAMAARGARVEWLGPFPAAAPAVEAMNAGAIDITVGSSTSSIASFAARAPIVLFAYQRIAPEAEALVVKTGSAIHSVADLAGHTVAVNRGGTGEYLLLSALQRQGIDPATVRRVYLGPADAGPAFASGAVDGWAIWDPYLSIALANYDARVLADGTAIGSSNAVVMIAHRTFATRHAALLRALYDAVRADNAWAQAHKTEAGLVWAREMHLPETLAARLGANNAVPTGPVGVNQRRQIDGLAGFYALNGIIPEKPDLSGTSIDYSE